MKKKIIALCLIVSMLAIAVISGTIAYFTDVEDKDNTFVIGDIDIAIKESNGDGIDNGADGDGDGYDNWLEDQVLFPGVPVKKIVTVKNVGENSAYVRVTLTVPQHMNANFATGYTNDWTQISKTTDADNNTVYVFKYNTALEAGKETSALLDNISVDKFIDDELNAKDALGNAAEKDVNVYAEAIQTAGFTSVDEALAALSAQSAINDNAVVVDDADSLIEALENGQGAVFTDDVKIDPAGMSNAYGTTGINVKNGQTIDGGGYTLDIAGAGGTWDSGISTTGGIIRNIKVTGAFRGVFVNHNSTHAEPVILENVIIDGTTYTISCDQGTGNGLTAINSTFNGWTSYAATLGDAKFYNCNFGAGNGYSFMRPYAPTTYENCNFEAGYTVDPRAEVTFTNCYLDGVLITDANVANLVTNTAKVTVNN